MKWQTIIKCVALLGLTVIWACDGDQAMEEEWTEWNPPLNICGGPVETERISYDCPAFDTISEYYSLVDQMPLYGEEEGDLEAYIIEQAEICGLEEIFDGHFILQTFISREGEPCVYLLSCQNVFQESKGNLVEIINNSGEWQPGVSGEDIVDVVYNILVDIEQGEIVDVRRL